MNDFLTRGRKYNAEMMIHSLVKEGKATVVNVESSVNTKDAKVEINCYNCFGEENSECKLCNGTKKIKVTENFARMMGYKRS